MTFGWGPTGSASGLKGTGYRQISTPTLNSGQQQLFSSLLSGIQPGLSEGLSRLGGIASGDQGSFESLERPALRQFNELLGGISSRFSGMGSGARRSSGFQNTASEAATDLAERLQSQRLGFQQNALQQLLGLSGSLLGTKTFETSLTPKQQPFLKQLLLSGAGGLGSLGSSAGSLGLGKAFGLF